MLRLSNQPAAQLEPQKLYFDILLGGTILGSLCGLLVLLAAWLARVIHFLSFSGVFYLRYRSGKWKNLAVVGAKQEDRGRSNKGLLCYSPGHSTC